MIQVHASCVAVDGTGVLLRGPSGSGKSDLALRLIDTGAGLIADDRTDLQVRDGIVWATAPTEIAGLIEVRGIGVLRLDAVVGIGVGLVIDLIDTGRVDRHPDAETCDLEGIAVPVLALSPFEASAPAKVRLAAAAAGRRIMRVP
jgi:HPr kinase/phosphorylase